MRIAVFLARENMAAFRRAAFDASRFLKQGSAAVRKCSKTALNAQVRTLMIQQSSLLKRSSVEIVMAKQAQQKFANIPRITSALLSTIPAIDTNVLNNGESGSSEALEGSGSDEEGLVTPAQDPIEDL